MRYNLTKYLYTSKEATEFACNELYRLTETNYLLVLT